MTVRSCLVPSVGPLGSVAGVVVDDQRLAWRRRRRAASCDSAPPKIVAPASGGDAADLAQRAEHRTDGAEVIGGEVELVVGDQKRGSAAYVAASGSSVDARRRGPARSRSRRPTSTATRAREERDVVPRRGGLGVALVARRCTAPRRRRARSACRPGRASARRRCRRGHAGDQAAVDDAEHGAERRRRGDRHRRRVRPGRRAAAGRPVRAGCRRRRRRGRRSISVLHGRQQARRLWPSYSTWVAGAARPLPLSA